MKHDDETHPPFSGSEFTQPPSTDDTNAPRAKGFRDPLGEDAVDHLRRYQVITVPPSARRALLSAQLPGASPELLYDTLPPNLGVQPDPGDVPEEDGTSVSVSPARQRRLRAMVIGVAALMLALALVAWARRPGASGPETSVAPVAPKAASPEPAPAPAVVEPTPTDSQVSASVPAQSEAHTHAAPKESDSPHRKSATDPVQRPNKEPSVAVSPPARSVPAADPATVPPAPPEVPAGKRFRLGSR